MERLSQFQPSSAPVDAGSLGAIEAAWRNRIRNVLGQQRVLPAGDRYIRSEDIANRTNPNKTAFRIQAAVQDGRPAIWVYPRVRIMTGLDESDIETAETKTEDSNVRVVVLPTWQRGILIGRSGLTAGDQRFTLGSRTVSTSDYWKIKHDIDFVSPRHEMLDVLLEGIGKPFSYPASCVFKAFEPGSPLDQEFKMTLADAGYFAVSHLAECDRRGQQVVVSEARQRFLTDAYHKDRFTYDEQSDSFTCPQGRRLKFLRIQHTNGVPLRLYRASGAVCQACPAFGVCTRARETGRSLAIGPHDGVLRRHRAWRTTLAAKEAYRLRKQLVEPVFGIIKEQQRARRFLLRGLANVAAEWTMLATAFNLRTLYRVWSSSLHLQPST